MTCVKDVKCSRPGARTLNLTHPAGCKTSTKAKPCLFETWKDVEEERVTYFVGVTLGLHLNFNVEEGLSGRIASAIQVQGPNGYVMNITTMVTVETLPLEINPQDR